MLFYYFLCKVKEIASKVFDVAEVVYKTCDKNKTFQWLIPFLWIIEKPSVKCITAVKILYINAM
jgi:hypothetical protein